MQTHTHTRQSGLAYSIATARDNVSHSGWHALRMRSVQFASEMCISTTAWSRFFCCVPVCALIYVPVREFIRSSGHCVVLCDCAGKRMCRLLVSQLLLVYLSAVTYFLFVCGFRRVVLRAHRTSNWMLTLPHIIIIICCLSCWCWTYSCCERTRLWVWRKSPFSHRRAYFLLCWANTVWAVAI